MMVMLPLLVSYLFSRLPIYITTYSLLLFLAPQVREFLYWPKNTPAHCKYAIPRDLAASLTNNPMDVN